MKKRKKISTEELAKAMIGKELAKKYERWNQFNTYGGSDPFWEDGFNMNLVRNHIIWYRKRCEEELNQADYPEEYFRELPPMVHPKYMADKTGIRRDATQTLKIVIKNPDYLWLKEYPLKHDKVDAKIEKKLSVVKCADRLADAIKEDNLLEMRRFRDSGYWNDRLHEARIQVEKLTEKTMPTGQMTIYDFL